MRVRAVSVRDFRSYEQASASLGPGLTVLAGPNGAGKTNLLEALYFGCLGHSCRTANEREVVRFGAPAARVVVETTGPQGPHRLSVGFAPGEPKRMRFDGASVERLLDVMDRPLVSVFLPDRLELVKGPPALRRAHLDQFVIAMWPSRVTTRRAYNQALAQRNALISRLRLGGGSRSGLPAWDAQLARHGIALMADRRRAVDSIAGRFSAIAARLGLDGEASIAYRPRSRAGNETELAAELAERLPGDLDRGFTAHGPHRDELVISRAGRELRIYGSQGEQRVVLLSLLLAEREAIEASRHCAPLMLLDDVMSELDGERRRALIDLLADTGQAVITTTDLDHVPGSALASVTRIIVSGGSLLQDALVT
ncbi:MAG: DNA replication/repair protein RecF [Solirubrobacteraceae bacterium]